MVDNKYREIKELSNHDLEEEERLNRLSTYDFYFHIESISITSKKTEAASKVEPVRTKW